nr:HAMP domain-containing sensor histidine kinase [Novosphingobium profundi]
MVLWWTLHKGFAQVERLASTLNARSLSDLEPLAPEEWPSDFGPIISSLNRLFDRLGGAYELEQAFTDDVAHELRTPLAAIRAQAQMVRKLDAAATCEDFSRLVAMVDRAHNLIEGMLVLARLNATSLALRSVDVHALVADVVADALINLPADAMECSVTPDHVVRWNCDAALLQIALAAVIGNATRHAREGGRLDIALVRGEDRLVVTVADRGPGIARSERERMTHRFEHGSLATSGSGLGLSIASKALGLLGGSLWLKDRPDGSGLLVVMTIGQPLKPRRPGIRDEAPR